MTQALARAFVSCAYALAGAACTHSRSPLRGPTRAKAAGSCAVPATENKCSFGVPTSMQARGGWSGDWQALACITIGATLYWRWWAVCFYVRRNCANSHRNVGLETEAACTGLVAAAREETSRRTARRCTSVLGDAATDLRTSDVTGAGYG